MVRRVSKGMREVGRYRSLLQRGTAAIESEDVPAILDVAAEVIAIKWHNPFWAGLVALAMGNLLRKAGWTTMRRLGWTLMGYGAANSVNEGIGWAVEVTDQIKQIKAGWGKGEPKPDTGGIGEP